MKTHTAPKLGKIVPCRHGYYYVKFPGVISRPRMGKSEAEAYLSSLRCDDEETARAIVLLGMTLSPTDA